MVDWLRLAAQRLPEHPALVFSDRQLSYRELDAEVTRAAGWLSSIDVRIGMRVGLYARPSVESVVMIFALIRIGAWLVPLNLRLTPDELAYQVGFTELVLSDGHRDVVGVVVNLMNDYAKFNGDTDIFAAGHEDTLALIFTSGTSGKPRLAQLTHGNFYHSALASEALIGVHPTDRWLCCLPLYHVGALALLTRAVIYGMTVVLHDGFSVDAVNHSLDTQAITHVSLVPTMLYRLLDARHTPPPHLKVCLLGGAAASADLVERAQQAGIPVATTYGLTEAASQVATQSMTNTQIKAGSVGRSAFGITRVWIEDESGKRLPERQIGEIVVEGKTVMRGYFSDPDATARTLRGSALHTGDLGYLDEDGDLWVVQRRSDLIVTGGENVYPAEVEAALKSHPAVRDACVVGIPHPEWGQQVAALLVTDHSQETSAILAWLRERIAGYKLPRVVKTANSLPLLGNGKIARKQIADDLIDYAK